jgi:hypothetical protein
MKRDIRVPTSIAHIGRYRVLIYDETAYRANIAQYYQGNESTSRKASQKQYKTPYKSLPKRSYGWYGDRVNTDIEKKGA